MNEQHEEVRKALSYDSLAEAERITGKSYKEDEEVVGLGMALHITHSEKKRELLEGMGDICHCCTYKQFEDLVVALGFDLVLEDEFKGNHYEDEGVTEVLQLWWNAERSILARAETYGGKGRNLNSATFYGACVSSDIEGMFKYTSSGGYKPASESVAKRDKEYRDIESARYRLNGWNSEGQDNITRAAIAESLDVTVEEVERRETNKPTDQEFVWVGSWHHEGIKSTIEGIDEFANWVTQWPEVPFLWFITYMESKVEDQDYAAITKDRFNRLPGHVKKQIDRTL